MRRPKFLAPVGIPTRIIARDYGLAECYVHARKIIDPLHTKVLVGPCGPIVVQWRASRVSARIFPADFALGTFLAHLGAILVRLGLQDTSKSPQDVCKRLQDAFKSLQGAPTWCPRRPKSRQRGAQDTSRTAQELPKRNPGSGPQVPWRQETPKNRPRAAP